MAGPVRWTAFELPPPAGPDVDCAPAPAKDGNLASNGPAQTLATRSFPGMPQPIAPTQLRQRNHNRATDGGRSHASDGDRTHQCSILNPGQDPDASYL
jgi:hypothetical protein